MTTAELTVDALRPDDASEMLRLASQHGMPNFTYTPGVHGAVVRDGGQVRAVMLLREHQGNFVVDELWPEGTRLGLHAMNLLADWVEDLMRRLAAERGTPIRLAGIVRLDNPAHRAALLKRDYASIADVLAKDFTP